MLSGKEAHDLGLVTELAAHPDRRGRRLRPRAGHPLARRAGRREATVQRHLDRRAPGVTFARERAEQLRLLLLANTRAAREAAFNKALPSYGPRSRR